MTQWLKQSTAATIPFGPFLDETDGKTAETGLTISQGDIRLSKNGGDIAQTHNAAGATHDELGIYSIPLDTTDTDTLGRLKVLVHESGALPVWQEFMVVPANVWDSMFGSDMLKVDVHSIDDDETAADNLELACDNYSATRGLAGTALPAAAADAAGGLPISDAGELDIDAKLANTNEITAARMGALTDLIDGGRLDLLIDAIKDKTDNLPADPADDSDIDAQLAAIAGYLDTEVAAILAAVDTEIAAIVAAVITNAAGADVAADIIAAKAVVDAIKAKTDNLPAAPAAVGSAMTLTAAYDDAKTAAQAGAEMDLIDAPNATALTALAVAILDTLLSEGDADALNARTIRSALRALRNKSSIAAGVLTVCKENDSDSAWTGAVTTDGAAEPITVIDPT